MEKVVREKLWTHSFCAVAAGNFLLFFAFYLLLPVLPMYLSEAFAASRSTAGFILSSYTITALMIRPFAGYMVDTFPRKKLLLICYFTFLLFFGGYLLAGTLLLFAIIRAGHGIAFGLLTVSNSTVAIDVMPSSRRGEGIGYYGVSNNLAMAVGPTLSLYIHDSFANFDYIFLLSMVSATIGLICVSTIRMPYRREPILEKPPVSLDRFILLKGIPAGIALLLLSIPYGATTNYVAVYAREIGLQVPTGFFFTLMAVGMGISRIFAGKFVDRGYITQTISYGFYVVIAAFFLLSCCSTVIAYSEAWCSFIFYLVPFMLGIGFGVMFPAYNTLYVNLAPNNQRGTATSTYLTSWDIGIGLGISTGGYIAQQYAFDAVYLFGSILCVASMLFFNLYVSPHYHRNKVR